MKRIIITLVSLMLMLSIHGCVNKEKAIDRKVKILEEEAALAIKTKNYSLAEEKLEAVLEFRPDSEYVINNLAVICAQYSNKPDKAIGLWSKIIDKNPDNAAYYNNVAGLYWQKGQIEKAIEHYKKASDLQPKYHMPAFNLAQIYLDNGDLKTAEEYARKSYNLTPKDSRVALMLSRTLLLNNKRTDASEVLRDVYSHSPQVIMTTIAYVRALIGDNDLDQATTIINKAMGESPMNPLLLAELIEISLQNGTPRKEIDKIVTQLKATDAKEFVDAVTKLYEARCAAQDGEKTRALTLLNSLNKKIPGDFSYFEGIRLHELAVLLADDESPESLAQMNKMAAFYSPERYVLHIETEKDPDEEVSDEK